MDHQKKFEKGYSIATYRLGASNLYQVEFVPRGLQQLRGAGNAPQPVPPGYQATVEIIEGAARFRNWDREPQDVDVASAYFEREAERRALEEQHRLQAA